MTRSNGSDHSVARRVAMASMTVLAASGIGLVAAPMAFGQIIIPIGGSSQGANVTNSGSASANSGGNNAIGNASTNSATVSAPAAGGLLNVPVGLGAPTNTSTGTAAIVTGPATAVGNSANTGVGQSTASGNQVNGFLNSQNQSVSVQNAGSASANTGGNNAVGNASQNTATLTQDVSGGLVGVGVNVGGPTNNSTGNAAIQTGAANAVGSNSATNVGQTSVQGGGGFVAGRPVSGVGAIGGIGGAGAGAAPCGSSRFGSIQEVAVRNQGQAQANTGNNTAIGNASTNDASVTVPQTVSGGVAGVGLTIGGPVNNSSGTAVINTGPANAVGNSSTTQVSQVEGCPQVTTVSSAGRTGVVVPAGRLQAVRTATLARTGLDTGDLGMIAGALLGAGMLLIASQRRRMVARSAAVPMAGFGFGLGGDR